jgi:RNA polymerase sigma factor (sigma-70 family)
MSPSILSEFEKLRPRLVRFFQMKGCPEDRAEDLAQETLYRVWSKYNSSAEPSVVGSAFADAVAHNVIHEWWREQQRMRPLDPEQPEPRDPRPGVLSELIEGPELAEKLALFRRCCDRLKPIHLRLFERYHQAPTAQAREVLAGELDISIEDLRARISYITRKIRRCLKVPLVPGRVT